MTKMYFFVKFSFVSVGILLCLSSRCNTLNASVISNHENLYSDKYSNFSETPPDYSRIFDEKVLTKIALYIFRLSITNKTQCMKEIVHFGSSLKEKWAQQMADASGKIPVGLLAGNINQFGQFDECLNVNNANESIPVIGKYCTAQLPIPDLNRNHNEFTHNGLSRSLKTQHTGITRLGNVDAEGHLFMNLGLCFPSSCAGDEVAAILKGVLAIAFPNMPPTPITIPDKLCSTADPIPWTGADYAAFVILAILAFLLLSSTIYDIVYRVYLTDIQHQHKDLFTSFSVWRNTERLLKVDPNPGPLSSLHGIRVLSIFWVIIAHRYVVILMSPIKNIYDMLEWGKSYAGMPILAAGVSVDTFFLMSGLLLSYTFFKKTDSQTFNVLKFYLHRYIRLTPALALMILLQASLFDHFGSGPVWKTLTPELSRSCRDYWWTTLLYVQNYVNAKEICLGHTWYLSVDMQLYILSPILLYPIMKNKKIGMWLSGMWTVLSLITVFVVCYIYEWPAAMAPLNAAANVLESRQINYYYTTHTRASPWLIGFCFGYLLRNVLNRNNRVRLSWIYVCIGWLSSFVIMGLIIFGMRPLQLETHVFSYLEDTTYLAFSRFGWAIAVAWVIFACALGYGGPVDWFLSLPIWQILARLSYSMYLVHLPMQFLMVGAMKTVPMFKNGSVVHMYFGDAIGSILLAYCLSITMESPITIIEKLIFKRDERASSPRQLQNEQNFEGNLNNSQQILNAEEGEQRKDTMAYHNNAMIKDEKSP